MSERFLFLIPARGGSKGLPGKNLLPVAGIPLVGRTARLAHQAMRSLGPGSRVVCTTDDPAIATVARDWGAEVPFMRPAALASDAAKSVDVALHAVDALGESFDAVVLLQPTSPLADVQDVVGAIALFRHGGWPIVSVCPAEHPVEWMYAIDTENRLSRLIETGEAPSQRQQARQAFRPNGAVYVCPPSILRRHDSFFGPDTGAFVMPAERSLDVDSAFDLEVSRAIVSRRSVSSVSLLGSRVGPGRRAFIVVEADHGRISDAAVARHVVDASAAAGADAIKVEPFQRDVIEQCRARGIGMIATAGDEKGTSELESLGIRAFHLAAESVTDLPLLRHIARGRTPLLISTRGASLADVARAVDTLREEGHTDLVLLHDDHPAVSNRDRGDFNVMTTLREAFGVPIGVRTCADSEVSAVVAVALGASVVVQGGMADSPDEQLRSPIDLSRLAEMVRRIRYVETRL